MEISIAGLRYRLVAVRNDGTWVAHAERVDTGQRVEDECAGATEADALDRLAKWLDWRNEHASALEALQKAEEAYQQTIAGSAFANPGEGPTAIELQKDLLSEVEAARLRLDEVRTRRPE